MKDKINYKKQDYNDKIKRQDSKLDKLTSMVKNMMDQIEILDPSPDKINPTKSQDPTTVLPANKKTPPSENRNYKKVGGMWNLKHEIISPKFYELIIKT